MDETEKRLLNALFDALAGEKKVAADRIYAQLDPDAGAKRLDRVASGELSIPPGLIAFVLNGPNAQRWIDEQVAIARRDPEADRQRALAEVRALVETGQALLARLGADLGTRRRGPVRVSPRERARRESA